MIDIILCCYKQEEFIKQAIESIYSQSIDSLEEVNLIVANDSPPDKTLDIIKSIPVPKWINMKILESHENLGFVKNYARSFRECKGEYVFILEGDDWWHDQNHIKKHLDFLNNHPQISMTMNRLSILIKKNKTILFPSWNKSWNEFKEWTIKDQIIENRLGNFSGCCFRGELIRALPDKIFDFYFADWFMGIIMAQYGNIAILKTSTSTYRKYPAGQWSKMHNKEREQKSLDLAHNYENYFEGNYKDEFNILYKILNELLKSNNPIKHVIKRCLRIIWRNKKIVIACLFIVILTLMNFINPK